MIAHCSIIKENRGVVMILMKCCRIIACGWHIVPLSPSTSSQTAPIPCGPVLTNIMKGGKFIAQHEISTLICWNTQCCLGPYSSTVSLLVASLLYSSDHSSYILERQGNMIPYAFNTMYGLEELHLTSVIIGPPHGQSRNKCLIMSFLSSTPMPGKHLMGHLT